MIVCHMGLRPDHGVQSRVHRHPQHGETPARITFPQRGHHPNVCFQHKIGFPCTPGLNWKVYDTVSDGIGSSTYRCSAVHAATMSRNPVGMRLLQSRMHYHSGQNILELRPGVPRQKNKHCRASTTHMAPPT